MNLVTGGAGFFGEVLVRKLLDRGGEVTVFDANIPSFCHPRLRVVRGDIRDRDALREAMCGARIVFHNVAQVPLANDAALFWSVNRDGTARALEASRSANVAAFVYTSSSAVFGAPITNPVTETTAPTPAEDYGRAKLAGEELCRGYADGEMAVSIIRPRTILGRGRLGIFQILFEWIYRGLNVPVIGDGANIYQFVHADDLADACITAGELQVSGVYNIGADGYDTMRRSLEALIAHAGSSSQVRGVSRGLAAVGMKTSRWLGLAPLAAYHALMYGESLYFDTSKAKRELKFSPRFTQDMTLSDAYDWYRANRNEVLSGAISGSKHQSKLRQGILSIVPYLI
jgi:nucleoside-diphosphate-sugar epimerase